MEITIYSWSVNEVLTALCAAGARAALVELSHWLGALTTDLTSRAAVEGRLRLHALPYLGTRPIGSFQPEHVRDWNRQLEDAVASAQYRRLIFDAVSSVLNAGVDDRLLASNPCRARIGQGAPSRADTRPSMDC
ncbi:hypothetical protein [Streptomyces sp. NPDC001450]